MIFNKDSRLLVDDLAKNSVHAVITDPSIERRYAYEEAKECVKSLDRE